MVSLLCVTPVAWAVTPGLLSAVLTLCLADQQVSDETPTRAGSGPV